LDQRKALTGILFVLKSGIPWEMLPEEMGCGSGMTCWRHLRDWQEAGMWQKLHELLLSQLREADEIDWSRALVDSALSEQGVAGEKPAPTPPTDASWGANIR
jgi:transposase